jgi:hypothetical protein
MIICRCFHLLCKRRPLSLLRFELFLLKLDVFVILAIAIVYIVKTTTVSNPMHIVTTIASRFKTCIGIIEIGVSHTLHGIE